MDSALMSAAPSSPSTPQRQPPDLVLMFLMSLTPYTCVLLLLTPFPDTHTCVDDTTLVPGLSDLRRPTSCCPHPLFPSTHPSL